MRVSIYTALPPLRTFPLSLCQPPDRNCRLLFRADIAARPALPAAFARPHSPAGNRHRRVGYLRSNPSGRAGAGAFLIVLAQAVPGTEAAALLWSIMDTLMRRRGPWGAADRYLHAQALKNGWVPLPFLISFSRSSRMPGQGWQTPSRIQSLETSRQSVTLL